MSIPVVIGGPSGVGKEWFCKFLEKKGWLYLEADQYPKDGIEELGLRALWNQFWYHCDAHSLATELKTRQDKNQYVGVVLSLPGHAIPSTKHLQAAKGYLLIRFLYGDPGFCLAAFLDRERTTGRNLPASHWDRHNEGVFSVLSTSPYHPYLINVFHSDGQRFLWKKVYDKIKADLITGASAG
jgi:hypothetical protein